jgi:hypothetical protein
MENLVALVWTTVTGSVTVARHILNTWLGEKGLKCFKGLVLLEVLEGFRLVLVERSSFL